MPLYEYQCPKCGRFEVIRKFSDPALKKCPTCGSKLEKLPSAPAIQFKGAGWYVTDYAKKSGSAEGSKGEASKKAAATGSDGSKAESASPAKSSEPAAKTTGGKDKPAKKSS